MLLLFCFEELLSCGTRKPRLAYSKQELSEQDAKDFVGRMRVSKVSDSAYALTWIMVEC